MLTVTSFVLVNQQRVHWLDEGQWSIDQIIRVHRPDSIDPEQRSGEAR